MEYFVSSDGIRLAYLDEGVGPSLLCLAGLTRNSTDFDYLAPHLPDTRLVRLDARGRGASGHADPATYTVATEARDALELLDHLGLDRTAILGTSRGGLIAMTLAATARDRLAGVCLNDIGPEIAPEGLAAIMTYLGRRPPQKTRADAAAARAKFMTGFTNVPMSRWLEEVTRQTRETRDRLDIIYDPQLRAAVEAAASHPTPDLWPLFDALQGIPLALIRGAISNILSPSTATEMRRRRPDMAFAEIPDRGHVPFLDEPQSLSLVHRFLENVR